MEVLLSIVTGLLISTNVFAAGVTVTQTEDSVQINYTMETRSAMFGLRTTKLNISEPERRLFGEGVLHLGKIEVEFSHDPLAMCLMGLRPHRGSVTIEKA